MSLSAKSIIVLVFCVGVFVASPSVSEAETRAQTVLPAAATPLVKVTNLHLTEKDSATVRLQWKAVAGAKRYRIRMMQGGVFVKYVIARSHHKVITGLEPDTVYTFRVRAKSGDVLGERSRKLRVHTKITIATDTGALFGFWGLNGYVSDEGFADAQNRFNATVFQVASSQPHYTVSTLLPMVRAAGFHVALRMTDDHDAFTTDGDFDIDKWKAQVAQWTDSGVQEFIDDNTLVAHMLLDDIDTFAGEDPTAAELDEMARYSKSVLPHLMTYVRQSATRMPVPETSRTVYMYLDAVDNQYVATDGDATVYADTEHDAALDLRLGVINGLNIADGGDGSSGQPGWRDGKYAMSADEIAAYGDALLSMPHVQMLLLWEYDGVEQWSDGSVGADYFDQTELQDALANLGTQATEYKQ